MKPIRYFNGKPFQLYYTDKYKSYVQKGLDNLRNNWYVRVVKGKDRNGKVLYGLYRRKK